MNYFQMKLGRVLLLITNGEMNDKKKHNESSNHLDIEEDACHTFKNMHNFLRNFSCP